MTMAQTTHGKTAGGTTMTDELARKAEAGFDADEIVRRRGGAPVDLVRLRPRWGRSG
jgi:hypothetical protein